MAFAFCAGVARQRSLSMLHGKYNLAKIHEAAKRGHDAKSDAARKYPETARKSPSPSGRAR